MTRLRASLTEAARLVVTGSGWLPWILGAAVLATAVAVSTFNGYLGALAINIGIWYLLAAGLNLVVGYSGQFSAGHAMLYGFGAYAAALAIRQDVPPILALPIAAFAGGLAAFLLAVPLVRLRGPFLAMATFAAQIAFTEVAIGWGPVTNGANGLIVPNSLKLFDTSIQGPLLLGLILATCLVASVVLRNLVRYRFGRALALMQSSELAAGSVGVAIAWHRIIAFAVSGVLAGIAGFWLVQYVGFIDPSAFDLGESIALLAAVVIGGRGSTIGPWIGVTLFYLLHSLLAGFPALEALLYGLSVIVVVTVAPGGLWGLISRAFARRHTAAHREDPGTEDGGEGARLTPSGRSAEPPVVGVPIVALTAVSKWFGGLEVLSNVSFTIARPGTVSALIGPNGAGKTTLLNLLTALDAPTGGRIEVLGANVADMSSHQVAGLGVARTFQVPRLATGRTAVENVVMGMHRTLPEGFADQLVSSPRARLLERQAASEARELLAAVGLQAWWHRDVADLPHGLRRFVEVARGLASRPTVMLLDEPGAGLEQSEVDALSRVLTLAAKELGITVLVVDHNMDLVLATATQVVVLDGGHIIAQGTPQEVTADPIVQDAYLGRLTGADVGAPA